LTFNTGLRGADRNLAWNLTLKTEGEGERRAGSQKKIIGLDKKIYSFY
jgi:hypothetical protein